MDIAYKIATNVNTKLKKTTCQHQWWKSCFHLQIIRGTEGKVTDKLSGWFSYTGWKPNWNQASVNTENESKFLFCLSVLWHECKSNFSLKNSNIEDFAQFNRNKRYWYTNMSVYSNSYVLSVWLKTRIAYRTWTNILKNYILVSNKNLKPYAIMCPQLFTKL